MLIFLRYYFAIFVTCFVCYASSDSHSGNEIISQDKLSYFDSDISALPTNIDYGSIKTLSLVNCPNIVVDDAFVEAINQMIHLESLDLSGITMRNTLNFGNLIGPYVNGCHPYGLSMLAERYSLQIIIMPDSLKEISDNAFSGCRKLAIIKAPNVMVIRDRAFCRCYNLREFYMPLCENIGEASFVSCALRTIDLTFCRELKSFAFMDTLLISVKLPMCPVIKRGAFYNCRFLQEITVPLNCFMESVDGVYNHFNGCVSLERLCIVWPSGSDNKLLPPMKIPVSNRMDRSSTHFSLDLMQLLPYNARNVREKYVGNQINSLVVKKFDNDTKQPVDMPPNCQYSLIVQNYGEKEGDMLLGGDRNVWSIP